MRSKSHKPGAAAAGFPRKSVNLSRSVLSSRRKEKKLDEAICVVKFGIIDLSLLAGTAERKKPGQKMLDAGGGRREDRRRGMVRTGAGSDLAGSEGLSAI